MDITLSNISKSFGEKKVLADLSIAFPEGRVSCLMGPSGCGKTTILNIVAGLVSPDAGSVSGLEGKTMSYAFQEPRLLPWKTVRENVEFVIKDKSLADKWLRIVHLDDSADLLPAHLSGGMAQRVSLARALALEADVVLLDEPFNGIDGELKADIISALKEFWSASGTTVIVITHDPDEASALSATTLTL